MLDRLLPIFTPGKSLTESLLGGRLWDLNYIGNSSSLLRSLDCAMDYLFGSNERQCELLEIGILRVVRHAGYRADNLNHSCHMQLIIFEDFIDNFEQTGLLERQGRRPNNRRVSIAGRCLSTARPGRYHFS